VRDLVRQEVDVAQVSLQDKSDRIERRISEREAYRIAAAQLRSLNTIADALDEHWESLLDTHGTTEESEALKREIRRLQEEFDAKIEPLAEQLKESSFVRKLSGSLYGYRVGSSVGGAAVPADGGYLRLTDSAFDYQLSSSLDRGIGTDPTVWLPKLFPWPPPDASSQIVLGNGVLPHWQERMHTLGDVDDTLNEALADAGYSGPNYFGVENGFALVTQLEQTSSDGVPLDGIARWSTNIVAMKEFSLSGYLRALLTAPPGYYRVLTFVITSVPFTTSGALGRFATIERWAHSGSFSLPEAVREMPYTKDHHATVLVYEFTKVRDTDDPVVSVPGRLTARQHLERGAVLAGLRVPQA
jgi:hypothetical protein